MSRMECRIAGEREGGTRKGSQQSQEVINALILLSMIFARRPKGVGKKQGCGVLMFVVLLSDKERLSTGAIEPVLEYG